MPGHKLKEPSKQDQLSFNFNINEVSFHLVLIGVHLFLVTRLIINFSAHNPDLVETTPSYLTPFIGRNRDSHDIQWETYRSNLMILFAGIALWKSISKWIQKYQNEKSWVFGFLMVLYSFRTDIFIYISLLSLWYLFTIKLYGFRYFVPACWIICILLLYVNELTNHFEQLSNLLAGIIPLDFFKSESKQISCGQVLNMTFLKLLSFSIDKTRGRQDRQLQKHKQSCSQCSESQVCLKARNFIETDDFSFKSFMNYVLFAPTLLTGPPISYKSFLSFKKYTTKKKPQLVKLIFLIVTFEAYQHYCPVIQLNPSQSFLEAEVITLFHLVFIWYKFLIIWKVARLWAAFCGIEVIDNLSRCVCNNYGFEGFWRMWHRGFNQWLVRYLYIPLGGNKNLLSVIATVAFVAFWHDHTINIIIWAFTLIAFILPEILIKRYARKHWRNKYNQYWFKYLAAFCSAIYIYFLVFSNIVGFGYGVDKFYLIFQKIGQEWLDLIWSVLVLTSAVILMFYQRSVESDKKNY